MRPLKERINITIDGDVLEKVKYEAEKDDRSLSQYINIVLKRHINRIAQREMEKEKEKEKEKEQN